MTHRSIEQTIQDQIIAFVRAFGLHKPDETPCGRPVSLAEAHALIELAPGDHLAQHELCQRLNLEKSTVSRLVGQLLARGWIERTRSTRDGRVVLIGLTEDGQNAAADLATARTAKFAHLVAALPESQRPQIVAALHMLVEALRERNTTET